jgi:hypothetical protein
MLTFEEVIKSGAVLHQSTELNIQISRQGSVWQSMAGIRGSPAAV